MVTEYIDCAELSFSSYFNSREILIISFHITPCDGSKVTIPLFEKKRNCIYRK
jgi:hypothetical protein